VILDGNFQTVQAWSRDGTPIYLAPWLLPPLSLCSQRIPILVQYILSSPPHHGFIHFTTPT